MSGVVRVGITNNVLVLQDFGFWHSDVKGEVLSLNISHQPENIQLKDCYIKDSSKIPFNILNMTDRW